VDPKKPPKNTPEQKPKRRLTEFTYNPNGFENLWMNQIKNGQVQEYGLFSRDEEDLVTS